MYNIFVTIYNNKAVKMLIGLSVKDIYTANAILIVLWHLLFWKFSVYLKDSLFNPGSCVFRIMPWEKSGVFYTKFLKIKKWKDKLPQYVAKNGFSKRNLNNHEELSLDYLRKFIIETCRAEWNHVMGCTYSVVAILISPFDCAAIFSAIAIVSNLPFVLIQRYNRMRLVKLYKMRSKASKNAIAVD